MRPLLAHLSYIPPPPSDNKIPNNTNRFPFRGVCFVVVKAGVVRKFTQEGKQFLGLLINLNPMKPNIFPFSLFMKIKKFEFSYNILRMAKFGRKVFSLCFSCTSNLFKRTLRHQGSIYLRKTQQRNTLIYLYLWHFTETTEVESRI